MATNQIKVGAIISYIALFVNVLIGLLYTPWLINTIGKSDYGLYTLAMSIIGLLAFDFGLGHATTKFVSQYLAEGRQDKVDNLLGLIYKLYLWVDVVLIIVLGAMYFFLPQIYTGLTPAEMERFSKVFLMAALFCVISFPFIPLNGILTSYEKFIQLKTCDLIHKLFIVVTMSVCLLLGQGLYALVLVISIAGILVIGLKLWVVKRDTPLSVNLKFKDNGILKTIGKFILWVTVAALMQRLIFNIAPSILGILSDSTAIAILGIVITLEGYVYLFANAINGMFLPRVSRLLKDNDNDAILELMTRVGRLQIYVIGFICVCLISLGQHFITVWIGVGYELVYPCLLLVVLPSFFHLPQEIGHTCVIAANKVKKQAVIYVVMGIANIVLSIPLTIKFGVIGMCISIFAAYLIRTIGLDIIFYKDLHINIAKFFRNSFLKMLIPLLLSCIIGISINIFLPISGWLGLTVKGVCLFASFALVMWITCMNKYEKDLVITPIRKMIKK